MAGLHGGTSPNDVKTAIDSVFQTRFSVANVSGYAGASDPLVFKQDTTDRGAVITMQMQGPGYFDTRNELSDVVGGSVRIGNSQTSTVLNYAKSLDISKNLFDDDQHSLVRRSIEEFARLAKVTQDKNALNVFNLGFTTQVSNDAVALFSNSHTALNGSTIDNLETGVLTDANLEVLMNSLLEQKTQDGTLGGHQPGVLMVPTALFKEANIIAKSVLRSGTGNNDMNYYSEVYPGLQVRFSPFLGASQSGSDTAYFLLSTDHQITRWVRQPLQTELIDWRFQRNNNYIYKAEYREIVDTPIWEGTVGSNGTV